MSTAVHRSDASIAENAGPKGVPIAFATVEEAIEDIRAGKMVIVVDAADRENEGDLTIAAQFATPEAIAFMAKRGRGLICLCLTGERCDALGLRQMTERNEAPTALRSRSRSRRARGSPPASRRTTASRTIQVAIAPSTGRDDLVAAGTRVPVARATRRRPRARRPDRGRRRSRQACRAQRGRRDLRGDEGRRHDGARARPDRVLRRARAEARHGRRPDRVPPPARAAHRARRSRCGCQRRTASSPPSSSRRC